ncbi:homoserine O- acetyltransferase [Tulasnella sp. 424]|nr:homoserine O- acetyltransferase [Tulasnella sp. 424]KAG8981072.1 homoserine O- acetyltransferase [Tulasnella sp. 425]
MTEVSHTIAGPSTLPKYAQLISNQSIRVVPSFTLESGVTLREVPVAYKTWGTLNESKSNVMIICHAFTGSADVEDWWGPLMGSGKAFDPRRFFIICLNTMGSPYGSASPVTVNPDTGELYGPEFPLTTIRDDVRLHKIILDDLGITSVAVVVGGSMGGMAVLEWPLCTPPGYVKHIVPIATSARHSAWCISWGETQRQSIYSDPDYEDGYYDPVEGQPKCGLSAARMAALLTYRSRDSFETRFGRKPQLPKGVRKNGQQDLLTPPDSPPPTPAQEALAVHNDGHRTPNHARHREPGHARTGSNGSLATPAIPSSTSSSVTASSSCTPSTHRPTRKIFTAQSYLRYQGEKFISRFDANCYIHITRKLDTHDIAFGRSRAGIDDHALEDPAAETDAHSGDLAAVLATLPRGALVISIETDGLFTPSEQKEIASHIPDAKLVTIPSPDGHDGFLLEFEKMNEHISGFLKERLPELYRAEVNDEAAGGFEIKKTSVFGEAELDVTHW